MSTSGALAYLGKDGSDNNSSNSAFDLKVGKAGQSEAFNMPNAAPGDSGQYVYHLENGGSKSGNLSINIPNITNIAETIGKFADGSGDLGKSTAMAFYLDLDASGDWSQGDIGLNADGGAYSYRSALQYSTLDSYANTKWNTVTVLAAGNKLNLVALWSIPATVGNEIQGDSVSFDISFTLTQAY